MSNPVEPAVWYLVFLFSVTVHEAAHAWAAKLGGDLTAYRGGQVSINPAPHIRREPFGMVALPLICLVTTGWPIGFASTPYDPTWAYRYPRRSGFMALAGPVSNLLIVILAAAVIKLGIATEFLHPPMSIRMASVVGASRGFAAGAAVFISMLFSLNLVLAVLNLIPIPPFDGSSSLTVLMPENVSLRYLEFISNPMFSWIGLIFAWQIFAPVFRPVFLFTIGWLYPGVRYM